MLTCTAQNTTNLPTSMYGIGELSTNDGGLYAGMGQTGIALNRNGLLNTLNPAAITHMDTACFCFEIGFTAYHARHHFLSETSTNATGNPNRFTLGFRIMPKWYINIGMTPYSSVGYLIASEETIEGTTDDILYSFFEGSGGLYKAFLTNAIKLTPRLSIGTSIGLITGKTIQNETQEGATAEHTSKKRALYTDFGLHYQWSGTNARTWNIGLTFSPSTAIYQSNELTYTNSSTNEEVSEDEHQHPQYLPMRIGAGIAAEYGQWLFCTDYSYTDWSRSQPDNSYFKYENQHKLGIGTIFITQPRKMRSIELMAGASVGKSYISLKDGKMHYVEVNAGINLPVRSSAISLGLSWRRQLNSRPELMQENRLSLNLNLTFGERLWKSKIR